MDQSGITKEGFVFTSTKHVFLLGKTSQGNIVYIDPQLHLLCDVKHGIQEKRLSFLTQANYFYWLQTTAQEKEVQKEMQKQRACIV